MFFNFPGAFQDANDGQFFYDQNNENQEEIDNTSYYEILEVTKDATQDQIKKAYRQKAFLNHPDKGGDPEQFKQITEAYEVLSNIEKRQTYDKYGKEGIENGGVSMDFADILGFGKEKQGGYKKVRPIVEKLNVTLEDIYLGKMFNIKIKKQVICEVCEGQGGKDFRQCDKCNGKKVFTSKINMGNGMWAQQQIPCDFCQRKVRIILPSGLKGIIIKQEDICSKCNGDQVYQIEKDIEVAVEKGIKDQHQYDLVGLGDELPGVNSGDVIVEIIVIPHEKFLRKGADLFYQQNISLKEALVGCHFQIQHLDGEILFISTRQGEVIKPNLLKMIKGKGMPFHKDSFNHGNLFVQFNIDFPPSDSLSQEQLAQLEQILPGPQKQKIPENVQLLDMEDFDQAQTNPNPEGGQDAHDDQAQGQRLQCAQQ